ncbi:MAG: alkaline phosphatase family protein [Desulfurococcaceae archaeon]
MKNLRFKLLYIVLDGAADSLNDRPTTLEVAEKPGLDELARRGACGLVYPVSRGIAPESDLAVISILGYNPQDVYTGRGPLEALGAGLCLNEEFEVAFRANFATIDVKSKRIVDRRVGRNLRTEEAVELAKALSNVELGVHAGYAKVISTIGHRAVVIIGSREKKLSAMVSNNDPAYVRKGYVSVAVDRPEHYIREITAIEDTPEARATAELANTFFNIAVETLSTHPVNIKRVESGLFPANAILLRDAGNKIPRATPLREKFGCRFAVLAEMPVEIGIGRAFGAETIALDPPTGNTQLDYEKRLDEAIKATKRSDIVYVHLKGPDEPGHDGDMELKKKRIEEIDRYFMQPLLEYLDDLSILVTTDHATPPTKRAHTDDPVPFAFYAHSVTPDEATKFTERECSKGSLGTIDHGWLLLPMILNKYLK